MTTPAHSELASYFKGGLTLISCWRSMAIISYNVIGQSLTLSCKTAPADWKKGLATITNTPLLRGVCDEQLQRNQPNILSLPHN